MTEVKLDPAPLREVAYRLLKADILACRLAPGQRITERQLAAETGLGISPIREALTRLDHEGLVCTLPRKGYQVKPLTMKSVDDLFAYWEIVGPEICRRGVMGATSEQIERFRGYFENLAPLLCDDEPSHERNRRASQIIDESFALMAEATCNDYLIATYHRISGELARVRAVILEVNIAETDQFAKDAAAWIDILAQRDSERAAQISRRFIEDIHNRYLRTLARWPSVVTAELVPVNSLGSTA